MNANIEMMKKIIEEKRQRGLKTNTKLRADKVVGRDSRGKKRNNGGGVFDSK